MVPTDPTNYLLNDDFVQFVNHILKLIHLQNVVNSPKEIHDFLSLSDNTLDVVYETSPNFSHNMSMN